MPKRPVPTNLPQRTPTPRTWTPTPTVSTAWTSMTGNCRHRRSARTRREALSDSAPTYVGAGAEIAGAGSGGVSHVTACPGPGGAAAAGGAEVVPGAVGTGGMQLRPVQVTSGSSCPRRRCSGSATPRGSSRIVPRWRRPTRSGIWLPGPARCSTGWSRTSAATCWTSPNWAGSPPGSWVRRSGTGTACARTRCAMCPRRAAIWIMSSRFPKDQPPQAISTANADQITERKLTAGITPAEPASTRVNGEHRRGTRIEPTTNRCPWNLGLSNHRCPSTTLPDAAER